MLIKINGAIKKAGLFLIACSTMVSACVVTTFSMFDDPPCKKRIMSQLFGHHNLNAIVCTYYVVLDRVDSLTKRFLFVPINDKIDSINGLAAAV